MFHRSPFTRRNRISGTLRCSGNSAPKGEANVRESFTFSRSRSVSGYSMATAEAFTEVSRAGSTSSQAKRSKRRSDAVTD